MSITKVYSEPNQTFKVKPFAKTINSWKLHFIESSISDVWLDFKLPSASLLTDVKKRVVWRYLRSKPLQMFYEKFYSKNWKGNTYTGVNLSKTCNPTTCIFIKRDFGTIIFSLNFAKPFAFSQNIPRWVLQKIFWSFYMAYRSKCLGLGHKSFCLVCLRLLSLTFLQMFKFCYKKKASSLLET